MNQDTPIRVSVPAIRDRKGQTPKISALTAYDVTFARLVDSSGIDIILVGDSVGSVVQGHDTTLPVTPAEMVYHCRCVSRGVSRALLVGDMPFMSYQISVSQALESAGRLVKEGGVSAVKLEGGVHVADTIKRLVDVDIPVMGHVGLTPQSYHRMGGNKIQGRKGGAAAGSRERIIQDALAVEEAGAFSIVLEGIPTELAQELTGMLGIPTIGIGAGPHCDGQIMVTHDMLGLIPSFAPRFVKRYATLAPVIVEAIENFKREVGNSTFPGAEHSFSDKPTEPQVARIHRLRY